MAMLMLRFLSCALDDGPATHHLSKRSQCPSAPTPLPYSPDARGLILSVTLLLPHQCRGLTPTDSAWALNILLLMGRGLARHQ